MRVQFTDNSKKIFTVAEMPMVNRVIEMMKEDELPLADYAHMVMKLFSTDKFDIYNAKAEIAKNHRLFETDRQNLYTDNSWDTDVWITFLAFNSSEGAYEIGVCLSDIWAIPADYNKEITNEIKKHIYVNAFTRKD